MEKRRSPWIAIILAIFIGLMVIVLLNGYIRPTSVVVARAAIAPGTRLTADLLELRTIPMQARPRCLPANRRLAGQSSGCRSCTR